MIILPSNLLTLVCFFSQENLCEFDIFVLPGSKLQQTPMFGLNALILCFGNVVML